MAGRPPREPSRLGQLLVEMYCWSELSLPKMQAIAAAAVHDSQPTPHPDLVRLAKLGGSGDHPQNMGRDFKRLVCEPSLADAISEISLPIRKLPLNIFRYRVVRQLIILPHMLFATIFAKRRNDFDMVMRGGSEDRLAEFWQAMEDHPAMAAHLRDRPNWQRRAIPLGLHGDGLPVTGVGKTWAQSAEAFSWGSLVAPGSTIRSLYLIFMCYKSLVVASGGLSTMDAIWRKVCWSFYWLWMGVWPEEDEFGRPWVSGTLDHARAGTSLAGGFFATIWTIKGDLEWLALGLGLNHTSSRDPCAWCRANESTRPWTNFRLHETMAILTEWTPAAWIAAHPQRHRLFRLPGVGLAAVFPDVLHVLHLGVYQCFFGSILMFLVAHQLHGDREANLQLVWGMIKQFYIDHHTLYQYGNIRMTMFAPATGQFPRLKGRGAEVRGLGRPLLHVFRILMDASSMQQRQMRLALEFLAKLEDLLDQHTPNIWRWPAAASAAFLDATIKFLACQTALGGHFHGQGVLLFHCTIKSHIAIHLARMTKYLNPKLAWCYAGEDMMGKVRSLVHGATASSPPELVVSKVLDKYMRALSYTVFAESARR